MRSSRFAVLTRLIHLSWSEHLLLVEAGLWLGISRLAVSILPFRCLVPWLGRHMAESPGTGVPACEEQLKRISWAVVATSRHMPWKRKCLAQAMAGKKMLQRRGIASTLYLGVAKEGENALIAHAWLRSGSRILTGARGRKKYTVVSTFADERAQGLSAMRDIP